MVSGCPLPDSVWHADPSVGKATPVCAYAASKSGVLGLVRGLANEWAQYGIRVNGIAPGVFPTDLNRPLIEGTPRGAWLKNHTPLGRFGDADELVGAAIYLISPAASYTTGETIVVDDKIRITVVEVRGDKVRLGIVAPAEVMVDRQEIHERRMNALNESAESAIFRPLPLILDSERELGNPLATSGL